jgi:16S rRNA (guanine966-N2)-methyltransferase
VRVIAGEKRGLRLLAPPGRQTRPTSDRVREAAFSMLESLGELEGATVWDLFAGSGAMGIEALSRGAARSTFVDQSAGAVSATRANLARVGYGPTRATVVRDDVLSWAGARAQAPPAGPRAPHQPGVDVVTADPPYAWAGWMALLTSLAPLKPLVLAETGEELDLPEGWGALRSRRYGGTVITLARARDNEV